MKAPGLVAAAAMMSTAGLWLLGGAVFAGVTLCLWSVVAIALAAAVASGGDR